jgi:hypothetical protein
MYTYRYIRDMINIASDLSSRVVVGKTHTHTHTHTCIYLFTCIYIIYLFIYTYVCIYIYLHVYIYMINNSNLLELEGGARDAEHVEGRLLQLLMHKPV